MTEQLELGLGLDKEKISPYDEEDKPACFGNKTEECIKELCDKWFDICGVADEM